MRGGRPGLDPTPEVVTQQESTIGPQSHDTGLYSIMYFFYYIPLDTNTASITETLRPPAGHFELYAVFPGIFYSPNTSTKRNSQSKQQVANLAADGSQVLRRQEGESDRYFSELGVRHPTSVPKFP